MKFRQALPTPDYLHWHQVSTGGVWEIGAYPVLFGGWNVAIGAVGSDSYEVVYWCGPSQPTAVSVLIRVALILLPLPENITFAELRRNFPKQTVRPILKDEDCLRQLEERVQKAGAEAFQEGDR